MRLDRAARHVAHCRETVEGALGRFSERVSRGEIPPLDDPDRSAIEEANGDLPIFVDAMLFYLRIQADAFAELVGYFYEYGDIVPGNFRSQLKWFSERRPTFDPGYASILRSNRQWFDRLSGDGGLRDVITHESAVFGVGWSKPQCGPIEPCTSLYAIRAGSWRRTCLWRSRKSRLDGSLF